MLVGVALNLGLGVSLAAALLFGTLISATDPVAVVAVFRQLGVPRRLLTLVEGESMLNGGVAIMLFNILLAAALSVAVAYGGFVLADDVLGFSGVMATVASGLVLAGLAASRASTDALRRQGRPRLDRLAQRFLGWLPAPVGEDPTELAYAEVRPGGSARAARSKPSAPSNTCRASIRHRWRKSKRDSSGGSGRRSVRLKSSTAKSTMAAANCAGARPRP